MLRNRTSCLFCVCPQIQPIEDRMPQTLAALLFLRVRIVKTFFE